MILDTNVLSALSSPDCPERVTVSLERAKERACTTAVNWAEICYGIARLPRKRGSELRERYQEMVLPRVSIIEFDQASAEVYARIRTELEEKGEPLADADLMIASMALRHDMTLVTGNTRPFARVPGLKVENWLEG